MIGSGRRIIEYEQKGRRRAEYGKQTLIELSRQLTTELGRGFSERNLENMRRFYLEYHEIAHQIPQTLSAKCPVNPLAKTPLVQALPAQSANTFTLSISASPAQFR